MISVHRATPKQVHETEKKKPFKFRQEATKHYEDARKPQEKEKFDPECTDRCHKCGDSLHREGFRCPVAKH